MTVLLDTSALVKLLTVEAETAALRAWLTERPGSRRVASALVRTELRRAAVRLGAGLLPAAERLLGALVLVPLDDALLIAAGTLAPGALRSLEALHLAAALRVSPVDAVVTYDSRMQDAATSLGLVVAAPGVVRRRSA